VDVALVSSIELFRRPGYSYLAGPAITGEGFVASVQVFLRKPLEELRSVALDPASRAARTLTRIVLPRRVPQAVRFEGVPPGYDPGEVARSMELDGWLRIGDAALREALAPPEPPTFNPCQAWVEDTGLPFCFAAWIVRPGLELTDDQIALFARARARGAEAVDELVERASREWDLPLAGCRRYLAEECRYDPGIELAPALRAFRDAAAALDLARGDLDPTPIEVPSLLPPLI
jgi:chorismate dehydratase